MTTRSWRQKAEFAGVLIFVIDLLVYIGRCLMHKGFYEGHFSIMVICAEVGFIVSVVTFVLALLSVGRICKLTVTIGSLVVAYLWFSDIAWWVMVK
jgi:hypothetical protein